MFFTLELNRIDDDVIERAIGAARALPPVDRGPRKEKPHQLEDVSSNCFTKSRRPATPPGIVCSTRPCLAAVQGRGQGAGDRADAQAVAGPSPDKRKAAAQALAKTFKDNERTFALITNTLAKDKEISDRWRGFVDVADSRHLKNRVEREVVDALVASVLRPIRGCRIAITR